MNNLHDNKRKSGSTQILGRTALPYDYEVEWIKSIGGAYIDTGLIGVYDFSFIAGRPYPTSDIYVLFGSRYDTGDNTFAMWYLPAYQDSRKSSIRFDYGSSTNGQEQQTLNANVPNGLQIWYNNTRKMFGVDNVGELRPALYNQNPSSVSHYLFAINSNGTPIYYNEGVWIKRAIFADSNGRVAAFKAVVKNGVGYLYDETREQLFGNAAGTGYFEVGPRIPNITKPWPQGTGYLYAAFNGEGEGTIDIWSDPNDLSQPRSMTLDVHTIDESRHESLLVRQLSV